MRRLHLLLMLALVALAAACSSGPPVRVFPPELSIQELRAGETGEWTVILRVRSFSTVPMQLSTLEGKLELGDGPDLPFTLQASRSVAAGSVELFEYRFTPDARQRAQVERILGERARLRYSLRGQLSSSEPRRRFDFDYRSALDPVPGLGAILR